MEAQIVDAIRQFLPALLGAAAVRGGTRAADELASGAGLFAKRLWDRIHRSVMNDRIDAPAAQQAAANPDDGPAIDVLRDRLGQILEKDPALRREVEVVLQTQGPNSPIITGDLNQVRIRDDHRTYYYDEDDSGWWARATGPARVVVLIGILLAVIGFGIGGFQILQGFQGSDAVQQAQNECLAKFPDPGFEQSQCMVTAAQQAEVNRPPMGQWIGVAGGFLFAGFVLTLVARLLPGAEGRRGRPR
jgi:hypothetical protein